MAYALVLGIAQDGGHPQPGCKQDCCTATAISNQTACVAIVDDGGAWLLDAGPDFRQHLARLDEADVEVAGILLTHGHIGHYTGLMFLGREAMNTEALPVWASPRLAAFISNNGPWQQLVTAGNIDLRVLEPDTDFALTPQVSAMAFSVPHRDEYSETVGFLVSGPDHSLVYIPDADSWDGWDKPVEHYIGQADVALLDATFFDRGEVPERGIPHPLVEESLLRFGDLDDANRAKINLTHLNHTNPLLNPQSDESVRVLRSGMRVAREGDIHPL